MCSFYRQDWREAANCQYLIYSQAKNQVFCPAGATGCTNAMHVKFGTADGHLGSVFVISNIFLNCNFNTIFF